jgi:hypothetical protein
MMQQLAKDISTAYDGHANRRTLDTPKRAASAAQYFEGVSVAS